MRILNNKFCTFVCVVFLAVIFSFFCSCTAYSFGPQPRSLQTGLKIASWNVQTFFDAVESGNEYAEFRGNNSRWNIAQYKERLKRLCVVIEKIDADIIALQEVENPAVVQDICNLLPVTAGYQFAAFVRDEKNPFGQAILSRLKIESVQSHQLFVQTEKLAAQPDLRPIAHFVCRTNNMKEPAITLLVCHWKSKSGGEEKSARWREAQEKLLLDTATALNNTAQGENTPIILALGDFNREPVEFSPDFFTGFTRSWDNNIDGGSYFYQGNWNRIDHIFLFNAHFVSQNAVSTARLSQFKPENAGIHATTEGIPFRYTLFNGEGFSDHFPVSTVLTF